MCYLFHHLVLPAALALGLNLHVTGHWVGPDLFITFLITYISLSILRIAIKWVKFHAASVMEPYQAVVLSDNRVLVLNRGVMPYEVRISRPEENTFHAETTFLCWEGMLYELVFKSAVQRKVRRYIDRVYSPGVHSQLSKEDIPPLSTLQFNLRVMAPGLFTICAIALAAGYIWSHCQTGPDDGAVSNFKMSTERFSAMTESIRQEPHGPVWIVPLAFKTGNDDAFMGTIMESEGDLVWMKTAVRPEGFQIERSLLRPVLHPEKDNFYVIFPFHNNKSALSESFLHDHFPLGFAYLNSMNLHSPTWFETLTPGSLIEISAFIHNRQEGQDSQPMIVNGFGKILCLDRRCRSHAKLLILNGEMMIKEERPTLFGLQVNCGLYSCDDEFDHAGLYEPYQQKFLATCELVYRRILDEKSGHFDHEISENMVDLLEMGFYQCNDAHRLFSHKEDPEVYDPEKIDKFFETW